MYDPFHQKAYGKQSVNYNRDVEAFEIVKKLADSFLPESNPTRKYLSPTDMGINMAGFAITNDENCCKASLEEIERRKAWYQQIVDRNEGDKVWLHKCDELHKKAEGYIRNI